MYWTLELASKLEDAPWPATKDELIDFAIRSGAPMEVVENLQELIEEEPRILSSHEIKEFINENNNLDIDACYWMNKEGEWISSMENILLDQISVEVDDGSCIFGIVGF